MANPQKEFGHIDIANDIAEALMKINVTGYQSRILWAIWRKTYGWHKKEDLISVSQLSEMTGLKHGHVSRTLKQLSDMKMITRTSYGTNRQKVTISFQKDYEKWKLVPSQVQVKTRTISGSTRTSQGTKLVPSEGNTKEKKETIQKKPISESKKTDSRIRVFLDWYVGKYEKKFGMKYVVSNGGKTGAQIKKLLASGIQWEDLQMRSLLFLLDKDPFLIGNGEEIKGAGYDIGVFLSRINKYNPNNSPNKGYFKTLLVDEKGYAVRNK